MILLPLILSFFIHADSTTKAPIPPPVPGQVYGKFGAYPFKKITFEEGVKNHSKYKGKYVQLEGKVTDVCKMAGCWAMITDGKSEVRISFKDYGFFVPREAIGKNVLAEGFLEEGEMNVKQHKHYLEEQQRPKEEIDKVDKPLKFMRFYSYGLKVL